MKNDLQIQKDVMEELKWQPLLTSSQIGVAVKNGIVTLSGIVDSYPKKLAAERAAKTVSGVKAVAEDIQVGISPQYRKTDAEIAEAILTALQWNPSIQEEKIKLKVEDGFVTLEGEVEWEFERDNVQNAVKDVAGVRLVTNLITLKPRVKPDEIEGKIKAAFHRSATVDAQKVNVNVMGGKVSLYGSVRSFAEKKDAEEAAWNAPGVTTVESNLSIEIPEYEYEE